MWAGAPGLRKAEMSAWTSQGSSPPAAWWSLPTAAGGSPRSSVTPAQMQPRESWDRVPAQQRRHVLTLPASTSHAWSLKECDTCFVLEEPSLFLHHLPASNWYTLFRPRYIGTQQNQQEAWRMKLELAQWIWCMAKILASTTLWGGHHYWPWQHWTLATMLQDSVALGLLAIDLSTP